MTQVAAVTGVTGYVGGRLVPELRDAGFRVREREEASEDVRADRVIRTLPPIGSEIAVGATVTLVVSTGPEQVTVPNVVGQDVDEARDRLEAARGRGGAGPRAGTPIAGRGGPDAPRRRPKSADDHEMVTGRNSVVEALRTRIPATTLYIAARIEMDERTKEILQLATRRGLPILEVMRPELDRITGHDSVHQGVALKVPPYEYAHPVDMLEAAVKRQQKPLFVALDGITDPRNLGAIIRSVAAFGGQASSSRSVVRSA